MMGSQIVLAVVFKFIREVQAVIGSGQKNAILLLV